ncbi:MAG: hypothetical protein II253_03445, partial [Lachnospiraceae bacterium]|nr:hypothetical protein [Lachnospiraceae bacterium]
NYDANTLCAKYTVTHIMKKSNIHLYNIANEKGGSVPAFYHFHSLPCEQKIKRQKFVITNS